jgi:hypothetical protein
VKVHDFNMKTHQCEHPEYPFTVTPPLTLKRFTLRSIFHPHRHHPLITILNRTHDWADVTKPLKVYPFWNLWRIAAACVRLWSAKLEP